MDPVTICAFGASIVTLILGFGVMKRLIHELSQKRKEKKEINKQQRRGGTLDESQDFVQRVHIIALGRLGDRFEHGDGQSCIS
jgi:hypothetical protein